MDNKRPELFIVAGPNGAGKTTITQTLLKHAWAEDSLYINPDDIALNMFGDWNSSDAVLEAAKYCQKLRYEALENKQNIVFETVLSSQEKIDYIRLAIDNGYFVRLFFVSTETPLINASRVAKRFMSGGHSVPIEKIITRYYKALGNLIQLLPIVDRCYVYDNSIDNETAKILFRTEQGVVKKIYIETMPQWAQQILHRD